MSALDFAPFDVGSMLNSASTAKCSSPVAASVADLDDFADWGKGADFRGFQRVRAGGVAEVAAVAGVETSTRPWSAPLAAFAEAPRPQFIVEETWDELVWEAIQVDDVWGQQALDLGWDQHDLFGCHPTPWVADGSRDGLVALIVSLKSPVRITAVETDCITLQPISGPPMRFRSRKPAGQSLLWTAYSFGSGP
ncbi:hypothetical protein [Sphingomonas prati]|uniref:hypothetical protein n=1 Tax=Sphingomonas prati TaxID=1843237 RepID=UPI00166513F1|nr:hypothetical protein [Sphingomonas prati]GGE75038.1 hypothetical protein GCM10011404_04450 [Sphingomonas prati]